MTATETLDQFVEQQLKTGRFKNYEELVHHALRMMQEHEQELDRLVEELREPVERFKAGEPGLEIDAEDVIRRGLEHINNSQTERKAH